MCKFQERIEQLISSRNYLLQPMVSIVELIHMINEIGIRRSHLPEGDSGGPLRPPLPLPPPPPRRR
jgi:hypothetical protein